MRKILLLLFPLLIFASCNSEEEYENWVKLSSENRQVVVSEDGSSANIRLTSEDSSFTFNVESNMSGLDIDAGTSDWIHASLSGASLTLSIDHMNGVESRSQVVNITREGRVYAWILVVQSDLEETGTVITVDRSKVFVPSTGGKEIVTVTTNQQSWEIDSYDNGIVVSQNGNQLEITLEENFDDESFEGKITVKAGQNENVATADIQVIQENGALIIEYTIPKGGGTIRLPLDGETDCVVYWGDDSLPLTIKETFNPLSDPPPTHTYKDGGVYNLRIVGSITRISTSALNHTDLAKSYITGVLQWGNVGVKSMNDAFNLCKNLSKLPEQNNNAFMELTEINNAFYGCASLTSLPNGLFKGASKLTSVYRAFSQCENVVEIPADLFGGCTNITDLGSTFAYSGLKSLPKGLFKDCSAVTKMASTFTGCSFLREIPDDLFSYFPELTDITNVFRNCSSLVAVPGNLFTANPLIANITGAFSLCYSLTTVPEELFANNYEITNATYLFYLNTSLKTVPVGIFDNNKKITSFKGAFGKCISWEGESPYIIIDGGLKIHLYEREKHSAYFIDFPKTHEQTQNCFEGCAKLEDYEHIRANHSEWVL